MGIFGHFPVPPPQGGMAIIIIINLLVARTYSYTTGYSCAKFSFFFFFF